ncbi:metallophosphoesterase family protein [Muricauda sp. NFXS6]|uniref:metallophosphoesterase family protein n=1 Tax=Allomuricauda sp. NFXS6 TaxID=2819094 RepID=UPI0032DE3A6F
MKIAAIYDIHGNPFALEAVLKTISGQGVDMVLVGGDVVAGPMPKETLSLLREMEVPMSYIRGNAETDLLRHAKGEEVLGLGPRAKGEAVWAADCLDARDIAFIESWAETLEVNSPALGDILFCHATPENDTDVFTTLTPEHKLEPIFGTLGTSMVICGHTHMQFDRKIAGVRVVNAGSVGMRFGGTGADWLLLDDDVHLMHAPYDLGSAAAHITALEYPNARDFATKYILASPSEEEALRMLSRLEM